MTRVMNVTGVDLSIGAVDEDITYFGLRQVTKAEIKKETTVSLTRKRMTYYGTQSLIKVVDMDVQEVQNYLD